MAVQETRWSFTTGWCTNNWLAIHTATGVHRSGGILLLLSKRFCSERMVRRCDIVPGRLLHAGLKSTRRPIDLLIGYQHMEDGNGHTKALRQEFWNLLDKTIRTIPTRNTPILAGDWNCSLRAHTPHVGTNGFTWQDSRRTGPLHYDVDTFEAILHHHDLQALNSFDGGLPPTYVNGLQASRIDFIIARIATADASARKICVLDTMPLQHPNHGHRPLLATIARSWIPYVQPATRGVTFKQRFHLRSHQTQN